MSQTAHITEVYSAIQGEGILVGERQIFVRFQGCNLNCQFCDTPASLEMKPTYRLEQTAGERDFVSGQNPIPEEDLVQAVLKLHKPVHLHRKVSLTGGEPLLHANFFPSFLPQLKSAGLEIYLETNGMLPDHFQSVLPWIDWVAMDMKLPSATACEPYWKEHRTFLKIAQEAGKHVFVKTVFTKDATVKEVDECAKLIYEVDPSIPFILQPVTPYGPVKVRPPRDLTLHLQAVAQRHGLSVRVIPQTHKIIGQL